MCSWDMPHRSVPNHRPRSRIDPLQSSRARFVAFQNFELRTTANVHIIWLFVFSNKIHVDIMRFSITIFSSFQQSNQSNAISMQYLKNDIKATYLLKIQCITPDKLSVGMILDGRYDIAQDLKYFWLVALHRFQPTLSYSHHHNNDPYVSPCGPYIQAVMQT